MTVQLAFSPEYSERVTGDETVIMPVCQHRVSNEPCLERSGISTHPLGSGSREVLPDYPVV